jgi:hypothetical protein
MRPSQPPLRANSSPSAELGVDVGGRARVRSAFIPHITREPKVAELSLGHFVGSTDATRGARSSGQSETCAGPSAAPNIFLRRRKAYELSNKLL